jgi:hypothetical protein
MDKHLSTRSAAAAALLLALLAAGCSDDVPQACEDVQALKVSLDELFSEETLEGGRGTAEEELDQVREDLADLGESAEAEVDTEVDELQAQLGDVGDAIEAADADDLEGSVDEIGAQLGEAGDAWSALVDQVQTSLEECDVDESLE